MTENRLPDDPWSLIITLLFAQKPDSTKAQADVENTNQPKSWKRRTREETHTRSISSVGKRSLEELDNEDQMDVDIVKKPRELLVVDSIGRAGGLLLFWKKECDLTIRTFSQNHIDFVVKDENGNMWRGTGIYGWPRRQDKHRTWALMRSLRTNQDQAWDMTTTGVKLTWSNGRRGNANVKKRLDRFLTNSHWFDLHPSASFENLARIASDHSPILCRLSPMVKKKTECSVLKVCGYVMRVSITWLKMLGRMVWLLSRFDRSTCAEQRVLRDQIKELLTREELMWKQRSRVQWLREGDKNTRFFHTHASNQQRRNSILRLKGPDGRLAGWNKRSFGHVQRSIKSKQKSLQILQSRFDRSTCAEQRVLRDQIKELLTREELMWKQRSRVQWLREGDKNTRFFHTRASNRQRRNSILRLKGPDGRWVEEHDEVCNLVSSYFSELFTSSSPQDCDSAVNDIDRRLTDDQRQALERRVTSSELFIKINIWDCHQSLVDLRRWFFKQFWIK
ncbi:hypothetical protein CTI12_AA170930 [Artemisia annua]|uniref:Uncharacterized protein n=1 Tax=Artemisia annua TaxID=35608 RepID=A0A2U1PBS9_ARTAN|nr:hypothetical protein CTI12_AA170930 [Artemisia annua]